MPEPGAPEVSRTPHIPVPSIQSPRQLAPLPVPSARIRLPRISRNTGSPKASGIPIDLIPLFYAALLFLAGIVIAHWLYLRPGLLLASLLPLGAIAAIATVKAPRLIWPTLAILWIVLGAWSAETERIPGPSPSLLRLSDGLLRTVEGEIIAAGPIRTEVQKNADNSENSGDPEEEQAATPKSQQIDLEVASAEELTDTVDQMAALPPTETPRLRILIQWPANQPTNPIQPEIQPGEHLRAVVRFLPPDTYHDPGVWDRAAYLDDQQITATGTLLATQQDNGEPRLTRQPAKRESFAAILNRTRNAASNRLQSLPSITSGLPKPVRASHEDAALLTALLTGDRTYLTRDLRSGFERTGSFHLIVVSGLHLAILAACVMLVCRKLRIPRLPATALTIAATLAYALFTGFAIPAQRSFWMITLYLIGRLLYRDRSPLNVIGFATLCLTAVSPRSIFDASLQMTLLSVAAIAGIAIPLLERTLQPRVRATRQLTTIGLDPKLPPKIAQFRVTLRLIARYLEPAAHPWIAWRAFPNFIRWTLRLGEIIFISLVVELALALPMAIYFHRITVYALPVNLLILPLLTLLVPMAMATLLALTLWPAAALVPGSACLAVLHLSTSTVRVLGSLSWSNLRIPEPGIWQIALATALFLLAIQFARTAGFLRRISFAALLLMAIVTVWPRPIDHPDKALLFQAIDVGQGDALLLISPDGKTLLVDAGGLGFPSHPNASPSSFDVGEEVVSPVLWSRGIRHLDAVALTHAHQDHMGGMAAVLRNFHPRELWVGNNPPVAAYLALLQQAKELGTTVRPLHSGETVSLGQANFRVLAPDPNYRPGSEPANNDSLVLRASFGSTSILLEGDAEGPEESSMRIQGDLQSTLLKVGHHGSLTSTHPEFLAAVHPAWAVISCGRRNRFGHPRPEILAELQASRTHTYRTDIDGTSCFLLDGTTVSPDSMCRITGH